MHDDQNSMHDDQNMYHNRNPMLDFSWALRMAAGANPSSMPTILAKTASDGGASDVDVYLVDFGQTTLEVMPDLSREGPTPPAEAVATTMAGRSFTDQRVLVADRGDCYRVWIPIVEGSANTGVIALTVSTIDDAGLEAWAELGILAGYLIAVHTRCTDVYSRYRRRHSMSLAASMQWDLLPPLVLHATGLTVAGLLEPAYDIGGDCFDYSLNGDFLDLAIFDAVGRGLAAARIASLTLSSYRHGRREQLPLSVIHENLGASIKEGCEPFSFATGVIGQIDLRSGVFLWTNAGHPPPLLIRAGRVIAELQCPPTPPWGIAGHTSIAPTAAVQQLEPDDYLLLYTDGIVDARTRSGEFFGVERLVDFMNRYSAESLRPEAMLRQLVEGVRHHQGIDDLRDDATAMLVRWEGARQVSAVRSTPTMTT